MHTYIICVANCMQFCCYKSCNFVSFSVVPDFLVCPNIAALWLHMLHMTLLTYSLINFNCSEMCSFCPFPLPCVKSLLLDYTLHLNHIICLLTKPLKVQIFGFQSKKKKKKESRKNDFHRDWSVAVLALFMKRVRKQCCEFSALLLDLRSWRRRNR